MIETTPILGPITDPIKKPILLDDPEKYLTIVKPNDVAPIEYDYTNIHKGGNGDRDTTPGLFGGRLEASREYVRLYGPIPQTQAPAEQKEFYQQMVGEIESAMRAGTYVPPENVTVNVYSVETQRGTKQFTGLDETQAEMQARAYGLDIIDIRKIGEETYTPKQAYDLITTAGGRGMADYATAISKFGAQFDPMVAEHYFGPDAQLPAEGSVPIRTESGWQFLPPEFVADLEKTPTFQDTVGDIQAKLENAFTAWTAAVEFLGEYTITMVSPPVGAADGEGVPIIPATPEEMADFNRGEDCEGGYCVTPRIALYKVTTRDGQIVYVEALDRPGQTDGQALAAQKATDAGYDVMYCNFTPGGLASLQTETYIDTGKLVNDIGPDKAEQVLSDVGIESSNITEYRYIDALTDKLSDYKQTDPETGENSYDLWQALKDKVITPAESEVLFGPDATDQAQTASNMVNLLENEGLGQKIKGFVGTFYGGANVPSFIERDPLSPESQLYLSLLYGQDQQMPEWKKILGFSSGVMKHPETIFTVHGWQPNPAAGIYFIPSGGIVPVLGIGPSAIGLKDSIRLLLRKPITQVTQFKIGGPASSSVMGNVGSWSGRLVRFFPKRGVFPTTTVGKGGVTAGQVSALVESQGLAAGMNHFGPSIMQKVYGARAWSGIVPSFAGSVGLRGGIDTATKVVYRSPFTGQMTSTTAGKILDAATNKGLGYVNQQYGKSVVSSVLSTRTQTIYTALPQPPTRAMLELSRQLKTIGQRQYELALRGFQSEYGTPGTLMRYVTQPENIGGQIVNIGGIEYRAPWATPPSNIVDPYQYFAGLQRTGLIHQLPSWSQYMQYWPERTTWYRMSPELLRPMPESPVPPDVFGGRTITPGATGWATQVVTRVAELDPITEQSVNLGQHGTLQIATVMPKTAPRTIPTTIPEITPIPTRTPTPIPTPTPSPVISPYPTVGPQPYPGISPISQPQPQPQPQPQAIKAPLPLPQPQPYPQPLPQPYPQPLPQPAPTPAPMPAPFPRVLGIPPGMQLVPVPTTPSMTRLSTDKLGIQGWRQGLFYISIFPPYRTTGNKEDVVYSRKRPPWVGAAKGRGSTRRSLGTTRGRQPRLVDLDVGAFRARVKSGKHLDFVED